MSINVEQIQTHFQALASHVPLRPVRSVEDYERAVTALNDLLDQGAADEGHPLANLAAVLGELVGDYEDSHYPSPDVSGVQMLTFLMEQNSLKQSDLPEVGTQGVVSEILSGKREINLRQVRGLKQRFGVSADAFV